jgi:iron complex outermembrane receptor protein
MAIAVAATTAPAAVMAQEGLVLEEIVVTATKKDEMVQDVPSTVNVLTGDAMKDLNVFNFKDVESMTPGLSLTNVDTRNSTISMRGVSFDPESRTAAAVVVYMNGVPVRSSEAFQQMYDLGRIEILRGPQGTLQGETSPSGSIQLYTKRANLDVVEGEIIQTFSDNSGSNTQVAANMPLIEGVLGIRVAGLYDDAETGVTTVDGRTGTRDSKSGRFSISFVPTDDLDMHLTYQYLESQADAFEIVEGEDTYPANGNPALDYSDRKSVQEGNPYVFYRTEFANLEVNYLLGDHLLTSVTGYQEVKNFALLDKDIGNGIPNYSKDQLVDTQGHRMTQEFRITKTDADFWEYTAGLFYSKSDLFTNNVNRADTFSQLGGVNQPTPAIFGAAGNTLTKVPTGTENFGAFLDNKFYLSDRTTLGVGARWSKIRNTSKVDTVAGSEGLEFTNLPNSFSTTFLPPGTPLLSLIPKEQELQKGIAWTGGIKLTHDLNEEVMVYGSFDRSYRPGGFVITPDAADLAADDLTFDAETSNSFEVGFKSTLDNGRYQINGALFYQEFTDFISRARTVWVDTDNNGLADKLISGGLTYNSDAIVQGAEVEFTGVLTENWTAFVGASYTDSKFDEGAQPCGTQGGVTPVGGYATCNTSGRTGPEPNWSISASSEYRIPMGEVEGFVRGLYKFTDNRADDTVGTNVGGYGLFDLFVGVRDPEGQWEVSAWSKNLFDKEGRSAIGAEQSETLIPGPGFGGGATGGYNVVSVIPEQTFGITGKYKFGVF